jgi:hypothetical protein
MVAGVALVVACGYLTKAAEVYLQVSNPDKDFSPDFVQYPEQPAVSAV